MASNARGVLSVMGLLTTQNREVAALDRSNVRLETGEQTLGMRRPALNLAAPASPYNCYKAANKVDLMKSLRPGPHRRRAPVVLEPDTVLPTASPTLRSTLSVPALGVSSPLSAAASPIRVPPGAVRRPGLQSVPSFHSTTKAGAMDAAARAQVASRRSRQPRSKYAQSNDITRAAQYHHVFSFNRPTFQLQSPIPDQVRIATLLSPQSATPKGRKGASATGAAALAASSAGRRPATTPSAGATAAATSLMSPMADPLLKPGRRRPRELIGGALVPSAEPVPHATHRSLYSPHTTRNAPQLAALDTAPTTVVREQDGREPGALAVRKPASNTVTALAATLPSSPALLQRWNTWSGVNK